MGFKYFIRQKINQILTKVGFELIRIDDRSTMRGALFGIAARGHEIGTIIDIGASDGRWTRLAMSFYPKCNYLLIEAQPFHRESLSRFCGKHENIQYVLAAAGNKQGEIFFDTSKPLGGQASSEPFTDTDHNLSVPMTTVDVELISRNLAGPYLLKLDTHGFEVPIFDGAKSTLKNTEVIIVESYNFNITPQSLLFHEMCRYLADYGFRCIDIVDLMHRPIDDSLWQMDIVFVRRDRSEFNINLYE